MKTELSDVDETEMRTFLESFCHEAKEAGLSMQHVADAMNVALRENGQGRHELWHNEETDDCEVHYY